MSLITSSFHSLIALGNPIVDIISEVPESLLKSCNMTPEGSNYSVQQTEKFFHELSQLPNIKLIPGGGVNNTVRVLGWVLNQKEETKNKYKISFLGCVGNDKYKNIIINNLKENNINFILQTEENVQTSLCGCGVFNKERYLIPKISASKKLSKEFILKNINEIINHDALLIETFFMQDSFEICINLIDEFIKNNKKILFTLGAPFIIKVYYEKVIEIANKSDFIFCNMNEAKMFMKLNKNYSEDEINKSKNYKLIFEEIHKLLIPKKRLIVVTSGEDGVFCSMFDYENNQIEFIFQNFPKKIDKKNIVDFDGAGDSFLGGFLSQLIQDKNINECCKIGNKAAGVVIRNVGCSFDMFNEKIV